MVAQDGYLPKSFAIAGHRLVFSVGIAYLATAAGLLLLVFDGITDRLIPLFAIGAFLTFTLSQSGMVVHWRRALRSSSRKSSDNTHLWINTVGALTTGAALIVIIVAKFAAGAWITLAAIPATIFLLRAIHQYYQELSRKVRDPTSLRLDKGPPIIIVPTESWNKLTDKALSFALSVSPDVLAVHLTQLAGPDREEHDRRLQSRWRADVEAPAKAAGLRPPRLITLEADYRAMYVPLLELAHQLERAKEGRRIAILIPQIVRQRWYQYLLHTFRTARLRSQLLKHGGPSLVVMNVPWYLDPVVARKPRPPKAKGDASANAASPSASSATAPGPTKQSRSRWRSSGERG